MNIETDLREFAQDFANMMGWDIPHIIRIKINKMERCKGWCIPDTQSDGVYILLSEVSHKDNKDFFSTLIHELIHATLLNSPNWKTSHLHGRKFRRMAKHVELKTKGFYTKKEII